MLSRISHAVSSRKRIDIIQRAKELGVKVTNPKARVTTEVWGMVGFFGRFAMGMGLLWYQSRAVENVAHALWRMKNKQLQCLEPFYVTKMWEYLIGRTTFHTQILSRAQARFLCRGLQMSGKIMNIAFCAYLYRSCRNANIFVRISCQRNESNQWSQPQKYIPPSFCRYNYQSLSPNSVVQSSRISFVTLCSLIFFLFPRKGNSPRLAVHLMDFEISVPKRSQHCSFCNVLRWYYSSFSSIVMPKLI